MKRLCDISIQYVKGVGPAKKKIFANLGVETIEDLFYFFPRRYEDRRSLTPISMLRIGEYQSVWGKIVSKGARRSWYTRKHVSETIIDDGQGRLFLVWFNQPYLEKYFQPGKEVVVYGKVDVYKNRLQIISPEYEIIETEEDKSLQMGRIVPIYPLTKGITQRYLRKVINNGLSYYADQLEEILPVWLRNKHHLVNIRRSIQSIHFPENYEIQEDAMRRVSFEEFFLFQISVNRRRMSIVQKAGIAHKIDLELLSRYESIFPFSLTDAQKRAIHEIAGDMQKPNPMLRLLQGDVGSGKTLVALFGCIASIHNGYQAAVMAPTEILARQHFENFRQILSSGKFKNTRIALLTSNLKASEKKELLSQLKNKEIDLIVGTHALISEGVDVDDLSFVVIDEQHKFGVRQRALLSEKGKNPDVLVMTATPIPRTLSLTLFGDLDVSVIDELPPGRGIVETKLFDFENIQEVYKIVKDAVREGQQVYIVYPIIEESEKLDLKAAHTMFDHFQKDEFKGLRLELLHGQMKRTEGEAIMQKFKNREIDILIATTVLEVGVDVPNANIMVIEHAERFGLAQLHQLRGRIGRGKKDAQCLLVAEPQTEDANARLKAILSTTDGFKIAEEDLMIRGPGHYFGRHQHGLNELKFANPITQIDILELARTEAQDVVHQDPYLKEPSNMILKRTILERYPGYLQNIEAG